MIYRDISEISSECIGINVTPAYFSAVIVSIMKIILKKKND